MTRSSIFLIIALIAIPFSGPSAAEDNPEISFLNEFPFAHAQVREIQVQPMSNPRPIPEYLANMNEFSRKISKVLRRRRDVQDVPTVFYPMSGYDSSTPVILFPSAKNIVAVDSAPFHCGSNQVEADYGQQYGGSTYCSGYEAGSVKSVAAVLVARLSTGVEDFRLRSVREYALQSRSSGVIEFHRGPQTQICRYIYIQGRISDSEEDLGAAWFTRFLELGFDAMINKASMSVWEYHAPNLAHSIARYLSNRHAFLISDTPELGLEKVSLEKLFVGPSKVTNFGYHIAFVSPDQREVETSIQQRWQQKLASFFSRCAHLLAQ